MTFPSSHFERVLDLWKILRVRRKTGRYELDGQNLRIADVVATAQYGCEVTLSQDPIVTKRLQDSVDILFDHLSRGWYVYGRKRRDHPHYVGQTDTTVAGVNTGFGGSADSRTEEVLKLQASLMQLTQSGILEKPLDGSMPGHSMPVHWVRAAMVVRCNHSMRGHSAVSLPVIKAVEKLLELELTPVVPLRGSVSASGDLMPLAYIAGSIEGNPDILIEKHGKTLPADQALRAAGLSPVVLGPKEGLGLVNGTSWSAALGALAISQAHQLAFLTQLLTGAAVEALKGSAESFHPFIARSRPHPGQIECARLIRYLLGGSHLARDVMTPKNRRREDLIQDRYSLRSAPQWIGPQLEDLNLADQQVNIELNSSCDNPLVDSSVGDIFYGCNFQAASITSAMEKVRLSLQMFGRMLFAQTTEMIDPTLSGGLPANLAADDPSISFTMKGVDINMAAYMAELSYLANPMSSHVQAAEMHNQSVNSMALASARMSMDALDILTKMCACHAYVVCQALDLRAVHRQFTIKAAKVLCSTISDFFSPHLDEYVLNALLDKTQASAESAWNSTSKEDLYARNTALVTSIASIIVDHLDDTTVSIRRWKVHSVEKLFDAWNETYETFRAKPTTLELLGRGSRALYSFIRVDLQVPFHEGFIEHPRINNDRLHGRPKKTVGGWVSVVHDSIKDSSLFDALMPVAADCLAENGTNDRGHAKTNGVVSEVHNTAINYQKHTNGHASHNHAD